jgi:hypothetical protein
VGPPDGVYIDGDLGNNADANKTFDVGEAEEKEVTLAMPPIAGTLLTVTGVCTLPDGSHSGDATIHVGAVRFVTSGSTNFVRERRADDTGRFTLEGIPSGHTLSLYAETADRTFAGSTTIQAPAKADPAFRITLPLVATVGVEWQIEDDDKKPMKSRKFRLSPKVGEEKFPFNRRELESDEQGRIKFYGIIPGLSYRLEEITPAREGPVRVRRGGRLPWYDKVLILAPEKPN